MVLSYIRSLLKGFVLGKKEIFARIFFNENAISKIFFLRYWICQFMGKSFMEKGERFLSTQNIYLFMLFFVRGKVCDKNNI